MVTLFIINISLFEEIVAVSSSLCVHVALQ